MSHENTDLTICVFVSFGRNVKISIYLGHSQTILNTIIMNTNAYLSRNYPTIKKLGYIILSLVAVYIIATSFSTRHSAHDKFVPYSAKVVSFETATSLQGKVCYQKIKLDNHSVIIVNSFYAEIDGENTKLIDYVNIGDSAVHSDWGTIYIYRNGESPNKFTYKNLNNNP